MAFPTIPVSLQNYTRIALTIEWIAHAPDIYDIDELQWVLCDRLADMQNIVGPHKFVGFRAEDGVIYVDDAEGTVFILTV